MFRFLRGAPNAMEAISNQLGEMLADCRHTFDVAMGALQAGEDIAALAADVRDTDERINATEEAVRRELLVHVAVHGGDDVGEVLADLLMVKKLERIGDQHKNILDLAEEGVRLADAPDAEAILALQREISPMFTTAATVLASGDLAAAEQLAERATTLRRQIEAEIRALIHSEQPASQAVPRALLLRYLKRIVANLAGVAMTARDGIDRTEREADGADLDE